MSNCQPLEVVGRSSETQLQVGENIFFLIYCFFNGLILTIFQLNDGAKDAMNQTLQEKYKYGVDDDGVTNAWDYLQVEVSSKYCEMYLTWK